MKVRDCRKKKGMALALGVALWACSTAAFADQDRQRKIEAAFLYNFFNYITWPGYNSPEALKAPVICIYNDDALKPYLGYIQRKVTAERALTIRTLRTGGNATGCHLLFVRRTDIDLKLLASDILTVSDTGNYLERGGMIKLAQENEGIALQINRSLLEKKGFNVSSRLLNLAQRIE